MSKAGGELPVLKEMDQRLLTFVRQFTKQHTVPPTIKEIMSGAGISSTSEVQRRLRRLQAHGLIEHSPMSARAYRPAKGIYLLGEEVERHKTLLRRIGRLVNGHSDPQLQEYLDQLRALIDQGHDLDQSPV